MNKTYMSSWLFFAIILLLVGCTRHSNKKVLEQETDFTKYLAAHLPIAKTEQKGWAKDIVFSLTQLKIPTTIENGCAVAAIIGQESGFNVNPKVAKLPKIAWSEIEKRANKMHLPLVLVKAGLQFHSKTGKTYAERLDRVTTEKELSDIYDELIEQIPLGQQLFGRYNPVHTAGPMQVSVEFTERFSDKYPEKTTLSPRQQLFTRRGGVFFGTLHLLGNPAKYDNWLFTFADYNAGWFASRNAAFQAAVALISATHLALDGDVVNPDSRQVGQTEGALIRSASKLGLSTAQIHEDLQAGTRSEFTTSMTWKAVFRVAAQHSHTELTKARLPEIRLVSPKINRRLTTAWFAKRVLQRFQTCVAGNMQ